MSTQTQQKTKNRLFVLTVALLLALFASVGSMAVEEATGLALNPAAQACGNQSGGC